MLSRNHRSAEPRTADAVPALPAGTRLVHVGMPKTGTTSVQGALDAAGERLSEHGVTLPAGESNPAAAVYGGTDLFDKPANLRGWSDLLEAMRRSESRIQVVSSEHFVYTRPEDTERIAYQLGGDAVHVAITLRPLTEVLPSLWQQLAQNGETASFEDWLRTALAPQTGDDVNARYLRQLQQRQFVEQWIAAVGTERTTVIVTDPRKPSLPLRTFETMAGLPEGLLEAPPARRNQALQLAEVELLQRCYSGLRELGWTEAQARKSLRWGAVERIHQTQTHRSVTRDIVAPLWAQETAMNEGAALAEWLRSTGVRVVGDPAALEGRLVDQAHAPVPLDTEVAAAFMVGALQTASGARTGSGASGGAKRPPKQNEPGASAPRPGPTTVPAQMARRLRSLARRATRRLRSHSN